MSLVQNVCEKASVRLAGLALTTFAAVSSLSGCAASSNVSGAEVAGIPVGRVITTAIIRGSQPVRKGFRDDSASCSRVSVTTDSTGIPNVKFGERCSSKKGSPEYVPRRVPDLYVPSPDVPSPE